MTTAKTPAKIAARKPAAKKPQDHKPKATDGPMPDDIDFVHHIVVEGVELDITLEFMTDFEFAEAGADVEDGNVQLVPRLLRRAVADPMAYLRVKDHLRDEKTRRIDLVRGAEFFAEFMTAVREVIEASGSDAD